MNSGKTPIVIRQPDEKQPSRKFMVSGRPHPRGLIRLPPRVSATAIFSGRYQPAKRLSQSERSPVYKALDTLLGMYVAVKLLPEEMARDPEAIRFLKHEASMAMGLSHPNIVRLHNLEVEHGKMFLVMEYVDGRNFRQILDESGRLSMSTVLGVATSCVSALAHAHDRGVLHRDLKPENVMLDQEDIIKIIDFGTAIPMRLRSVEGQAEFIEGTPGYMSPEEALGQPLDGRTDVFSLGVTLAEMLTGVPVFPRHVPMEEVILLDPAPLTGVPERVAETLRRAMARKREDRWSGVQDFHEALERAIRDSR